MRNSAHRLQKSDPALPVSELQKYIDGWLLSCQISRHSDRTLDNRRDILDRLKWFLDQKKLQECGVMELRLFLAYLNTGHEDPGGRWGNPQLTKPVKSRTSKDYHATLRTLFNWIVAEGGLDVSPMERIPVPVDRPDAIEPFTEGQVKTLLEAAKKSRHPRRDEALFLFLLDTGCRASEVCDLNLGDVDMSAKKTTVDGKGGKTRPVYFSSITGRALWQYLREDEREPLSPLFQSERGERFTRSGLRQLIERIGDGAGLTAARCCPHTFRHTFAVSFLRAGGNQFTLMQLLGHTNLAMTARYVKLAQADVENQHRQFSPVEMIKGKGSKR